MTLVGWACPGTDTQFNFVRRHQKAPDCSNINELFHLGGRYYLSTQHGSINVYNTTNGSSHILHISPLIVYHFPCDLTFASQQTGLGTCPDHITFHLPLFSHKSFRYIPWTHNDDKTLRLHYSSLNLTPPLQFDNKTMTSLDHFSYTRWATYYPVSNVKRRDIPPTEGSIYHPKRLAYLFYFRSCMHS